MRERKIILSYSLLIYLLPILLWLIAHPGEPQVSAETNIINKPHTNRMTLKEQMELAGRNLLYSLESEENYLPYWMFNEDGEGWFRPYCQGHNIGRVWDALLRLEDATGFTIPGEIEAGLLAHTWSLCDNPAGILLDHPNPNDAKNWYIHSYRETMLAFNALVRFRNSRAACLAGRRAVELMSRYSIDLNRWNFDPIPNLPEVGGGHNPVYTHGRAIEGMVWFYEATGDPFVLNEARRLAEFHLKNTTNQDGSLAKGCGHHTHSYLNTLRGLILYGELTHQRKFIERVEATYHSTVKNMITPSGFIYHDIGTKNSPEGEVASAGDIAQIALWLWRNNGDISLLDDVERIVRARLLPSQIMEGPDTLLGALGGAVGLTSGKSAVTDITAATLHSLIDVYNNIVQRSVHDIRVHFHFDYHAPDIVIISRREEQAILTLTIRNSKNLFIRVPGWTSENSVKLTVNGIPSEPIRYGAYVFVPGNEDGLVVELTYDLPERITTESAEREYTLKWRGDEIIGAYPVGKKFPFYPELKSAVKNP